MKSISDYNQAEALLIGETNVVLELSKKFLKLTKNNFVERPWGGVKIRSFKGLHSLPDQVIKTGMGGGEAFELSACKEDEECQLYPSRLKFDDGSEITLSQLLDVSADELLGDQFIASYGKTFPLLIKTLDIKELLSVQGHPEGNTELYIIIDAEPGATIRLGFKHNIDADQLQASLLQGRLKQEVLARKLSSVADEIKLQKILRPWFADHESSFSVLLDSSEIKNTKEWLLVEGLVNELKDLYWHILDSMNEIPVESGKVLYNANPSRALRGLAQRPSAEVHALGNPERHEILALEVRLPGPTYRAWDNLRFPVRDIDVSIALNALNLGRTKISEFIRTPTKVKGKKGTFCSLDNDFFCVEHLKPDYQTSVVVSETFPHYLYAIKGTSRFIGKGGDVLDLLTQGESAIVPKNVGQYQIENVDPESEVIKVSLPIRM